MAAEVISMNTHPARGRLSTEEMEDLVVRSEHCTLCRAKRGDRCRVYQAPSPGRPGRQPEIGKERSPHRRRLSAAYRHGIL